MTTLRINPFSGIAGNMLVGALLDLGADTPAFWEQLHGLPMAEYHCKVSSSKVLRRGMGASYFEVRIHDHDHDDQHVHHHHDHEHGHAHGRSYADVIAILAAAKIADSAKTRAQSVFTHLAEAEAKVHHKTLETIHFHEVGAFDAIVDITAACIALEQLQVDEVSCATVALGGGTVHCAHGTMPVPVPAVVELLNGAPTTIGQAEDGEWTTPTGAALIRDFVHRFDGTAAGIVKGVGYGAGKRDPKSHANVVQAMLLTNEGAEDAASEQIAVLSCNIDDMPGERLTHLLPLFMAHGALDVTVIPCMMKKGRSGFILQVMANLEKRDELSSLMLTETTSFGVRWQVMERRTLAREMVDVATELGPIAVKLGYDRPGGRVIHAVPEFESCQQQAVAHQRSLNDVYDMAVAAARDWVCNTKQEEA